MKIGIDGTVFTCNLTGIGNYSYNFLIELAKKMPDDQFVILTNHDLVVEFSEKNIVVSKEDKWPQRNSYLWKLIFCGVAAKIESVDVFWATNGMAPFYMPCPVMLTVYDFVYKVEAATMSLKSRLFRSISQPFWIKRAKKIFTISNAVNQEMVDYFGIAADAVIKPATGPEYIPQSDDVKTRVRKKFELPEIYNLVVGTLEPRKNIVEFIHAYLDCRERYSEVDLPLLVIIGGKGWKDGEILSLIESGEKKGIIKRLGYVDHSDLPALYSAAETFFMPSRYEGFGMPALEARMCGTAVACADVAAIHEAAGDSALYHSPTREGISAMLESLYVQKDTRILPSAEDVDWSWESGADSLKTLFSKLK